MLDAGRQDVVREFRLQFENEMRSRLVDKMEELTGRKIVTYQSQILFDPDIVFEIFVFDRAAGDDEVTETAEGQLGDRAIGETTEDSPTA